MLCPIPGCRALARQEVCHGIARIVREQGHSKIMASALPLHLDYIYGYILSRALAGVTMLRMKRAPIFFSFLFLCSIASSETMYLTFVSKESKGALAQSEVSFRMDDAEVPLTEFLHVDTTARDANVLAHPVGRRQYVLLIDFLNLTPSQVLEIRKLAQDFVAQVPKEDLIALAGITNEDGLRFFSGFTADRSKLITGWNAMGKVVLSGMMEGPDGNLYSSTFSSDPVPPALLSDEEFLANLKTYEVDPKTREELSPLFIQAFVDLASLLSTIQGRKNVILFSPGTDVKGLRVDLKEMKKEEKEEEGEDARADHKTLREITQLGPRDLEKMAKQGLQTKRSRDNDANVVSRLIEGTDGHVHIFNPSSEDNGFLKDLAEKTIGSYRKLQEFASSAPQILSSDQNFYILGWQGQREKSFHELHIIQMKAGNTKADFPLRWLAPKPLSEYSPLEKKAHLAQAQYRNFPSSDQYRFWSDIILDDGLNRVSTFTEVLGNSLIATKAKQMQLDFYGFAIEQDGTIVDFYHLPVSLDLSNATLKGKLQKAGLKVWNVLFAGHGPISLRTVVLNSNTGETFTHSGRIPFRDTDFLLTNPFFPSYNFEWVFWPKPDQVQTRRGKEVMYPYKVGPNIFFPELSPRVQADDKGKVIYFKVYNFSPGEKYPSVRLRLLGDNGTTFEIEKFGLMQEPRLVQRGGVELFWTIETLPGLSKGNYRLRVDVIDRGKNKEVIRDVETYVE